MWRRLSLLAVILALVFVALPRSSGPAFAEGGGSISGRVIHDLDGDGDTEDADEPGLSGWRVLIKRETEEGQSDPVETKTGKNGEYRFDGLASGDYEVSIPCEDQPSLWIATSPGPSGYYGTSVEEGRESGPEVFLLRLLDEPPQPTGSVSGRLIWDENRNSQPDPSEEGVAGWTVYIGMRDAPACFPVDDRETVSSADGTFAVSGLMAGTYAIFGAAPPLDGSSLNYVLDYPGVSLGDMLGFGDIFLFAAPVEVPEDGTGNVTVGVLDVTGTASISGEIYRDLDQDGMRDDGESFAGCDNMAALLIRTPLGYALVEITLGIPPEGNFSYPRLAAGEYRVYSPSVASDAVVLAAGENATGVLLGLRTDSCDTLPVQEEPTSAPPTETPAIPTPVATTSTPPVVGPPGTGTGTGDDSRTTSLALPALLAVCGLVALSTATVWRWRANSHRGGSR